MELSKEEEEEGESSSFDTRQLGGCFSLKGGDSEFFGLLSFQYRQRSIMLMKIL